MTEVDEWLGSKKKTYWKAFRVTEGGWSWFLFVIESYTQWYCGTEDSEEKCLSEIKWAMGSYLNSRTPKTIES